MFEIGMLVWSLEEAQGGIQRCAVDLAKELSQVGTTLTFFHKGTASNLPDLPNGQVVPLAVTKSYRKFTAADIDQVRRKIRAQNLDALIFFASWDILLLAPFFLEGTGIPLVVSEHNNPRIIESERWNRYERIGCMAGADAIHVLTDSYGASLPEGLRSRTFVIPNPAPECRPVNTLRTNTVLMAGRFVDDHKQFALGIAAFSLFFKQFPSWRLLISGDGPYGEAYRKMVKRLGLSDAVTFTGMLPNLDAVMQQASIFCIPSRYEGFPMVVLEAQSHGLPVVGFSSCSGVNEMIIHNLNGKLAKKMEAGDLARQLASLAGDARLREALGNRGRKMLDRYDRAAVYAKWNTLLAQMITRKGNTALQRSEEFSPQKEEDKALAEILSRSRPFARSVKTPCWWTHATRSMSGKAQTWFSRALGTISK